MAKYATITSIHHDYVARYAALAGMSVKAAIEYAIEATIVPELIEFGADVSAPDRDSERLIEEARRMLPAGWSIYVQDPLVSQSATGGAPAPKCATTLVLHFGIGGPFDFTEVTPGALLQFCLDLKKLAEFGGVALLRGQSVEHSIIARRRGKGITFANEASAASHVTAKTSIPTRMVDSITNGFEKAVEAAQRAEEE